MARSLVLGNGRFLVNFDDYYRIRDIYFPRIGIENHTIGRIFRFGVWADGATHWVGEHWEREIAYEPGTLVGATVLRHRGLGLEIHCRDAVDFEVDIFCRELRVRDLRGSVRQVRLFLHHDFHISGSDVGDTALYDPELDGVIHYKRDRYFMIGGGRAPAYRLSRYATGKKQINGAEGTWRDAEGDGWLSGNPIAQGAVDSTVSLDVDLPAGGEAVTYYWLAAGERYGDLVDYGALLHEIGPAALIERTSAYWHLWIDTHDLDREDGLPERMISLYKTSLLVMRTHVDEGGAIIAATDSDITQFARDTYSYMWPRDGALVADAFARAGYPSISQRFYDFASRLIKREGYFLHKYHPDRSLASSWHPWVDARGRKVLPIQEDETALVLWALWRHFALYRGVEEVQPLYRSMIVPAAEFLASYRDSETGLPLPSWDLWEERRGVMTFTAATVWAGLDAGARFARSFGDFDLADRYAKAAEEVRTAILERLWDEETGRFLRLYLPPEEGGGEEIRDATPDSSLFGLHFLGMLEADDPKLVATLETVRTTLSVPTEVGGLARYSGDYYHAVTQDWERVPGNPWFIAQCWLASWQIARAETPEELEEALEPLEWVADHATSAGLFPEQLHPFSGMPLSVTPLTWSHAQFVATLRDYLERAASFENCPRCGKRGGKLEHGLHEIDS